MKQKFFLLIFFTLISYGFCSHEEIETRVIAIPKLEENHLGQRILCHRPMRTGTPAMYVETADNKLIAHNYGHGGSGWTLGPGAAKFVIDSLENEMQKKGYSVQTPVTVIGAGAIGLFSALELYQRGYKDITVVARSFDNLTSHNAGGLLAPVSMNNAPKLQAKIDQIGIDAYKFFRLIAEGKHPVLKQGAVIVPTYFENRETSGLEPYVGKVMQPAKDVVLDFKNGTKRQMVVYDDGIFMDTANLMTSLKDALEGKVKFAQKFINSFQEIKTPLIINCSGLGAKTLVGDDNLVSVQGHLVMLKDQNPKDLQYMILVYYPEALTASGKKITRSFYFFPKSLAGSASNDMGVIGGTFIEGADSQERHEEEYGIMIKGAESFFGLPNKNSMN